MIRRRHALKIITLKHRFFNRFITSPIYRTEILQNKDQNLRNIGKIVQKRLRNTAMDQLNSYHYPTSNLT